MSVTPAAPFLVEFGHDPSQIAPQPGDTRPALNLTSDELAAQIEEAYARGFHEGAASAEADIEARHAKQRALFEQELALSRHNWSIDEAQVLARQLTDGLHQIETRIADAATKILKPFLSATVQHQAIGELRNLLVSLMSGNEGLTVHVSGPEDLLGDLRKALNGQSVSVCYTVTDGCDIRIVIGQTRLETSLDEWLSRISEAVV